MLVSIGSAMEVLRDRSRHAELRSGFNIELAGMFFTPENDTAGDCVKSDHGVSSRGDNTREQQLQAPTFSHAHCFSLDGAETISARAVAKI